MNYQGRDNWDRPVYETDDGRLYVDVEPRKDRTSQICTKYGNAFNGGPDMPVKEDIEIEFIPRRDTWY